MKEKKADIDILEDLLSTQKQYIEDKDYQKEHNIKEQAIDYAKMWTKATETLIAKNKELKVNNKKLQDKCKELIFEKQELTSALLDSTPNDKIKAKIEIRKEEKENCKDSIEEKYLLREIYVLQSLLGKE